MPPETKHARSGDVYIAYQVVGEGPLDLVFIPGFVSHVEANWQSPGRAKFQRQLGYASIQTTPDRDGHLMPPLHEAEARKLARLVFGERRLRLTRRSGVKRGQDARRARANRPSLAGL
jgi:hypothetical protein